MPKLKENAAERLSIDRDTKERHGGDVLMLIAENLACWSAVNPHEGTYSQRLAIYSNELVAQSDRLTTLTQRIAELEEKLKDVACKRIEEAQRQQKLF